MSYSSEDYHSTPRPKAAPFFRPTPRVTPPEEEEKIPPARSATRRAAQASMPINVKIVKPTGKINLVLALDTTSSMGELRDNIKGKMVYFCDEIKNLLPDLVGDMEIAFVGIADHCDGKKMLQSTAFSADVAVLTNNLKSIVDAHGGDVPEAYECLFKAADGWDIEGTNTVFILVADSVPHGAGYAEDNGCPDGVDWQKELTALKKKVRAFYFISCSNSTMLKRLQRLMVDDQEHFIELGTNVIRLTNIVHGIIAKEVGEIDKYLAHLAKTRGQARATEVETLLKTQSSTKS